jgi:hypothetical protein
LRLMRGNMDAIPVAVVVADNVAVRGVREVVLEEGFQG